MQDKRNIAVTHEQDSSKDTTLHRNQKVFALEFQRERENALYIIVESCTQARILPKIFGDDRQKHYFRG